MSVSHPTAIRNDLANFLVGNATSFVAGSNHKLKIFNGTPPANAQASLSGNTAIATISAIVWGVGSGGVVTVSSSTGDPGAVGGTATFYRLYRTAGADPSDVIEQGTVGTSGADLILSSTTIIAGALVNLTGTNTITAPN